MRTIQNALIVGVKWFGMNIAFRILAVDERSRLMKAWLIGAVSMFFAMVCQAESTTNVVEENEGNALQTNTVLLRECQLGGGASTNAISTAVQQMEVARKQYQKEQEAISKNMSEEERARARERLLEEQYQQREQVRERLQAMRQKAKGKGKP